MSSLDATDRRTELHKIKPEAINHLLVESETVAKVAQPNLPVCELPHQSALSGVVSASAERLRAAVAAADFSQSSSRNMEQSPHAEPDIAPLVDKLGREVADLMKKNHQPGGKKDRSKTGG